MRTRAVLITGAGRRIGAAIARDLSRHGWGVVLHFHTSGDAVRAVEREIQNGGGEAVAIGADLTSPGAAADLVSRAFVAAPGLELVVNNASTFTYDSAATAAAKSMLDSFSINTIAAVTISQRFAELLPPERNGSIVNILDNRVFAPNPDYFSYGVSKFATLGATRMLALALAPRIRVNGIAPGITLPSGEQTQSDYDSAHRLNPLGRGCSPGEIAAAVRLIAESPGMTGTVITIDGGLALANPGRDVAFINPGST